MFIRPNLIISDYWEAKHQGYIFGGVTIRNKESFMPFLIRRAVNIKKVYVSSNGINTPIRWWCYQYKNLDLLFKNNKIVQRPEYLLSHSSDEHLLLYYSETESKHKFIFDTRSKSFEDMYLIYIGDETLCFHTDVGNFCIKQNRKFV